MARHYYSMGRAAAARLRLESARSIRESDSAAFPPGVHRVEVAASFRDGSVRVRGAGGRELLIRRPGRRAPPAGSRVRIEVWLEGDVDVVVAGGTAYVVDSAGTPRHEAATTQEALRWISTNKLRLVKPVARLV